MLPKTLLARIAKGAKEHTIKGGVLENSYWDTLIFSSIKTKAGLQNLRCAIVGGDGM